MKVSQTLGIALVILLAGLSVASAQSWQPLQHQPSFEASTALQLTDGTVLVHQYGGQQWWRLTPDASGSYVNGTWSKRASLPAGYAPLYYASAVLPDGRVVVEGGEYNFFSPTWTNLGAIYDPIANAWTSVAPPSGWSTIGDAQNVVLPNGKFLLANCCSTQAALLNASNLTWTAASVTGKADSNNEEGWTLLPDGTVLTVDTNNPSNLTHAEKYVPTKGKWISAGSTIVKLPDTNADNSGSHEMGPGVLRPDGTVFMAGAIGHNSVYHPPTDPRQPGTWVPAPDFPNIPGQGQLDIADGPASLLPNGNVLCAASPGIFRNPVHFFEYDGTNLTEVVKTPNANGITSFEGRMLLLPTGQVMFTDGTSDVEIYTSTGSPDPAWAPVITNVPTQISRGTSFVIGGTLFNGLSEAVAYGDDASAATNYPLVRVTNLASGHVFYLRTHDHSRMGVAFTGPVRTHVDVGNTVETGVSSLEVVANGIASAAVTVTVQ
jgi:hypothetical protein